MDNATVMISYDWENGRDTVREIMDRAVTASGVGSRVEDLLECDMGNDYFGFVRDEVESMLYDEERFTDLNDAMGLIVDCIEDEERARIACTGIAYEISLEMSVMETLSEWCASLSTVNVDGIWFHVSDGMQLKDSDRYVNEWGTNLFYHPSTDTVERIEIVDDGDNTTCRHVEVSEPDTWWVGLARRAYENFEEWKSRTTA